MYLGCHAWNLDGVEAAIGFSRCRRDSQQKCCNRRRRHPVASRKLLPLPPAPRLLKTKSHKWRRIGALSLVPYMRVKEQLEPDSPMVQKAGAAGDDSSNAR